jgi:aspartyl-tRNA(Asn)/glutamyl-tRNA(Gln) amidotransferase subunit A
MDSLEFVRKAKSGDVDIEDNLHQTISAVKSINKDYHYLLTIDGSPEMPRKKGRLYGLPITVKDCICVKGMESKAGSNILEGYDPLFDATVIEKIKDEGGIIIGKANQDLFGFGSFNVNVGIGYPVPKNPVDDARTTGGSSGGSAGITKKLEMPHIAIAESTGGSIACPAAYCGVYGMTPTYGRVSRYGLIDYASSMDKIGIMAKDIEEIAMMLGIISGYDEKDSTSADIPKEDYSKPHKGTLKIGVIKESLKDIDPDVRRNTLSSLKEYDEVSLPLTFKYGIQAYYLISMSEASTNLAKLCGMRYGRHEDLRGTYDEYFTAVRSKNFSKEAKRRIILGTFARMSGYRDAYYLKALKVRTRIVAEYKKLFKDYDILISPTMPNIAPRFDEIDKLTPLENYMMDIMTVGPNIAGFPHISIPSGVSKGMPTGIMAISDHFQEKPLIDFARRLR